MTGTHTPLPNRHCPLCGGPNGCEPARTGTFDTRCWCATTVFDPQALQRVPAAQRGLACLCRACATGETKPPSGGVGR